MTNETTYTKELMKRFRNPKYVGELENANAVVFAKSGAGKSTC